MIKSNKKRILLAMSGGVDSSVAAFLLEKQGYDVTGLYFKMVKDQEESLKRVRKATSQLGFELIVKDLTKDFNKAVVAYFLKEYQSNRTPNPCVVCNSQIKFKQLLKMADDLGIEKVATGHYAKIKTVKQKGDKHACSLRKRETKNKSCFLLKKARDSKKDQTYFLYRLKQVELSRTLFPLGDYTKEEIKKINKKDKIIPEKTEESQDACFFSNQESLKDFLDKKNIKAKKGLISDEKGLILGKHKGLVYYTQGQRYGLGLSGGPFYVIKKDEQKNQLIVSRKREHSLLENIELKIKNPSWIVSEPVLGRVYEFKSRYQAKESLGTFKKKLKNNTWEVLLKTPQWATAKGQSLVVYEKDKLVGGGILL
jgi:tRNA-uridine 2-sulfurtransferase